MVGGGSSLPGQKKAVCTYQHWAWVDKGKQESEPLLKSLEENRLIHGGWESHIASLVCFAQIRLGSCPKSTHCHEFAALSKESGSGDHSFVQDENSTELSCLPAYGEVSIRPLHRGCGLIKMPSGILNSNLWWYIWNKSNILLHRKVTWLPYTWGIANLKILCEKNTSHQSTNQTLGTQSPWRRAPRLAGKPQ